MSQITLYTHPWSRGRTTLWMLEELKIPYQVKLMDFSKSKQKDPEFLKINPMGQLPTLTHGETVVTEGAAICLYLADAFPQAGLAPAINDPLRAPYLRWMIFATGSVEAAMSDKFFPRAEAPKEMAIGYGKFEDVVATLEKILAKGPWALGEKFSALDVYLGGQLWAGITMGKILEPKPVFTEYLKRLEARPAYQAAEKKGAEQMKEMGLEMPK
jgi:glutathione S-transferase